MSFESIPFHVRPSAGALIDSRYPERCLNGGLAHLRGKLFLQMLQA